MPKYADCVSGNILEKLISLNLIAKKEAIYYKTDIRHSFRAAIRAGDE
jgi:hypothetical protein